MDFCRRGYTTNKFMNCSSKPFIMRSAKAEMAKRRNADYDVSTFQTTSVVENINLNNCLGNNNGNKSQ